MAQRTCSIEGCERTGKISRGWCPMHYWRWWKFGDPFYERTRPTEHDRFWAKVEKGARDECWLWKGGHSRDGYGMFKHAGGFYAHRFSYETCVGAVPAGRELDHLCRVRHCVRPDHLEPVTRSENLRRGKAGDNSKGKTHCKRGHEFSEENTQWRKEGKRACRTCRREADRRRYHASRT